MIPYGFPAAGIGHQTCRFGEDFCEFLTTGKTLARFSGAIDRKKEPREFWWTVTIYYLFAVFLFLLPTIGRPW
jgi:hypothetical protein